MNSISVVIPVYRSTKSLFTLVQRVITALEPIYDFEIILVDDGSPESTWQVILDITRRVPNVRGIRLGRNFGQHSALLAGIRSAKYSLTVTIDDDAQNPPEAISSMVEHLLNEELDVVYGTPETIKQPWLRRISSSAIRSLLGKSMGVEMAKEMSSFRVFRTETREAFQGSLGSNISIDALLSWGSSKFGSMKVPHDHRESGSSTYNLQKLLRFSIDTITGYSTKPLQFASVLGLVTAGFGFGVFIYAVTIPFLSGESVSGFPFLASSIAIFSGVQLLTLGVIGEYLSRMHFRVMNKPSYHISEDTSSS
jgi:undecaprenyl-phosphate 4-deoxy-4-formamido-L-arabinose transferase